MSTRRGLDATRGALMHSPEIDTLRVHGDRFVRTGMLDFAVNVWPARRPPALQAALIEALKSSAYPDDTDALAATARRHGRPPAEALALNGACEAFWLLAHALKAQQAVCVHPSFTEAEAALRAVGAPVTRVLRAPADWVLAPERVPPQADLVVLTNPNNPTGTLDAPAQIERLARPGRTLVVDESFADFVPHEHASVAARRELPGLVVLRSLTKLWGLAGVRAGYLLGPAALLEQLAAQRQPWSVSAPALAALRWCAADRETPARVANEVGSARAELQPALEAIPGVRVWPGAANFLLIHTPGHGRRLVRELADDGIAVRPCASFPGLGDDHIRVAVRTPAENTQLAQAIAQAMSTQTVAQATSRQSIADAMPTQTAQARSDAHTE
jgi:histidinol-phosphate/aromatic aminotransferase/cobyric acid decarboxylase-like protein